MRSALLLVALAAMGPVLKADVIYNNFDTNSPTFNVDGYQVIVSNGSDVRPSFEFSTSTARYLTELDFAAGIGVSNTADQVTVTLSADNGGAPAAGVSNSTTCGGSAIICATFTNLGVEGSSDNPPGILTWIPGTEPLLAANTNYWITFDAPASGGDVFWNNNVTGAFGDSTFGTGGWTTTSNTLGALEIIGSTTGAAPTPEPGTFVLLCAAFMGALALRKCYSRG